VSYESENKLQADTSLSKLYLILNLLGYRRLSLPPWKFEGQLSCFHHYNDSNYQSWSGVELSVSRNKTGELIVSTRTNISGSHYDLQHQNNTIRTLQKFFGGSVVTDEGKGRYFHPDGSAPSPSQSGCHKAFQHFGGNLIKTDVYLMNRVFPNKQWEKTGVFGFMDAMNPRLLSNNLLLPYLVAVLEDYFKSTFVALLKYSDRKESFLKGSRLSSEQLCRISSGSMSVEEAVSEILPFQSISAICQHFHQLEPKLDLAGALKRPYRRRKQSLFITLDHLVKLRHDFIHRAEMDTTFTDNELKRVT